MRKLVPLLAGVALTATFGMFACRTTPQALTAQGDKADGAVTPFTPEASETATGQLVPFASDQDFEAWMQAWRDHERAENEARMQHVYPMKGPPGDAGAPPMDDGPAPPAPAAAAPASEAAAPKKAAGRAERGGARDRSAAQSKDKKESITNNQEANVDEGDIVKLHGNHLIVLRRGRIFTVDVKNPKPLRSNMQNAFGPDLDPNGTWYDEMLVEGDNVVVVGFSYARGGTEIGLFKIDAQGGLQYRSTYHLRSNDYYSARNYASRIVNGRLVFYTPTYVTANDTTPTRTWPAMRRWHQGVTDQDFVRVLPPAKVYHLAGELPPSSMTAMHTVTSCDLSKPTLDCESVGMMGPPGRVFYVSDSSVYVWMREWSEREGRQAHAPGILARLPLGRGSVPTAVRVGGMPTDQFSFDEQGGELDVMVRTESNGDAMFASETTAGRAALLRLPLGLFSGGVPSVALSRYRNLTAPADGAVQNRFVGSWLLYGAGNGYWRRQDGGAPLYATRVDATGDAQPIMLEQGVDRIEAMGDHAVVVGSRGSDLVFSPIELGQTRARAARDYVRKNASQGELRSHGFFYHDTSKSPGHSQGIVGLPIRGEGARGSRYLSEGSASVLFLAENGLALSELGQLETGQLRNTADGCRASCVDWYGNARPIFVHDRMFALMGYELVEGSVQNARLQERSRLDFGPRNAGPSVVAWGEE